ncbi:hypothetical protein ATCV1_z840R [Acanthocystis turfacea chlorella virus 1]|uniref:Uncharacterized protein z840R n=1 Tax=Chlorovirus heliozoae TaxID=322019 RepID=A7KAA0_9PHYC|nr:hypothetical protein ATCV1_z840R [Acanthocystis turfacea chlorella virus 1]ABT16974.1 hypothetical protein ATCV1_z840R [Acanthocystis turfacea chlorella virus 1]
MVTLGLWEHQYFWYASHSSRCWIGETSSRTIPEGALIAKLKTVVEAGLNMSSSASTPAFIMNCVMGSALFPRIRRI